MVDTTTHVEVNLTACGLDLALHARLVTAVHWVLSRGSDRQLAVAWPDFNGRAFGRRFRVFGKPATLMVFLEVIAPLPVELVEVSGIRPTPAADQWTVFRRDHTAGRKLPSRIKAINSWRERRGISARRKVPESEVALQAPYLQVSSQSGGDREFSLFINRADTSGAGTPYGGGRYGLGIAVPVF